MPTVLIAAGGLMCLLFIGAIVYVAVQATRAPEQVSQSELLAWLPPDSELVIVVRVPAAVSSPFLKTAIDRASSANQPLGELLQFFDLKSAEDIELIASGVAGLSAMSTDATAAPRGVLVIRASKDVSRTELQRRSRRGVHRGHEYFVLPFPDTALYLADGRTAVVGTEAGVKAAIERGRRVIARPDLEFVDMTQDVVVAWAPQTRKLLPRIPGGRSPAAGMFSGLIAPLQSATAGSIGITFRGDAQVKLQIVCENASRAAELKTRANDTLFAFRQLYSPLPGVTAGPGGSGSMPSDVRDTIGATLKSTSIAQDNDSVVATAAIPVAAGKFIEPLVERALSQMPRPEVRNAPPGRLRRIGP